MKKFLASLLMVLAVLLLALPASAEVGTSSLAVTNTFYAASTNTTAGVNGVGSAVLVDGQDNCALLLTGAGHMTDTGNLLLTFARSADNSTWETTPHFTWLVPLNSTTAIAAWTQLPVTTIGAAGYIKCVAMWNTNANSNVTNVTLKVVKKTVKAAP